MYSWYWGTAQDSRSFVEQPRNKSFLVDGGSCGAHAMATLQHCSHDNTCTRTTGTLIMGHLVLGVWYQFTLECTLSFRVRIPCLVRKLKCTYCRGVTLLMVIYFEILQSWRDKIYQVLYTWRSKIKLVVKVYVSVNSTFHDWLLVYKL